MKREDMLNTIKLGCRAETKIKSIGLDNKGTKAEINARVEKYMIWMNKVVGGVSICVLRP